ncbi:MAG: MATE family efflux transporter [Actinobacteria bacterium]|nr:MATE family efflux transporter [Actinomycetota bacterium]
MRSWLTWACPPPTWPICAAVALLGRRHPQDAEILRLALPAFGALVAEPLFLLADSAIVGRLGTVPLGGLGVASQALTTLVGVSIFLAYGTTAAVARQLGAGHRDAAIRQGIDGLWLAAGIGAVVLAVGWPLAPRVVLAFGGTPAVSQQAVTYLRISLLSAPSMLAVLAGTGILRGLQDTRTPLLVAGVANAVNIALNAAFVLGLHWGIAGSAWGTVIAQTGSGVAYLVVVARGARRAGVSGWPDPGGLRLAARAGAALVLRTLALQAVLVLMTAIAARQSDAAIAASQVGMRVWSLFVFALDAIAIAAQAITGRYLGAGDIEGTRSATQRVIAWGAAYGAIFSVLLLVLRPVLPSLFGVTPQVRGLLLAVLLVVIVQQPVAGVVFVLDGVLIGAGDQDYLAVAGLVTLAVFGASAALVVSASAGLVALWLSYAAWMLARFLTLTLRARGSRWLVTGAVRV